VFGENKEKRKKKKMKRRKKGAEEKDGKSKRTNAQKLLSSRMAVGTFGVKSVFDPKIACFHFI